MEYTIRYPNTKHKDVSPKALYQKSDFLTKLIILSSQFEK